MELVILAIIVAAILGSVLALWLHRRHENAGRTWRDNMTIIK